MAAKKSKALVWVLLILLIVGLGGFGARSFTGSVTKIGKVGDKPIMVSDYINAVQQRMNQLQQQMGNALTFQQAQAFGIPNAVISQLVNQAALDNESQKIGLSMGDANLAKQIEKIPAFQDSNGKFSRDNYKFALQRVGMKEPEFEAELRDQTVRSILQGAVASATRMPAAYGKTIASYLDQSRAVSYVTLGTDTLDQPIPAPTDDQLQAFYKDHIKDYTAPEKKQITYALLTPAMMSDKVKVDQSKIEAAYDARKDEFEKPETRMIERLVFPDEKSAEAAKAKLDAGSIDFDGLVKERGLDTQSVTLGQRTKSQMSSAAAGDAVFAAASGSVVGPVKSGLGPALYRINGVVKAQVTPKDQAYAQIRKDLAADGEKDAVANQKSAVEDELAGGATLEDLTKDTPMKLGTIDWYQGMNTGIAAHPGFAAAAQALTSDDYPEVKDFDDGSIYAMRLDKDIPAAAEPFDKVKDAVAAAWTQDQTMKALDAKADALIKKLKNDKASLSDSGLKVSVQPDLQRGAPVDGTPNGFADMAFGMNKGDFAKLDGKDQVLVMHLDSIALPGDGDPKAGKTEEAVTSHASQGLSQDLYEVFVKNVRNNVDVSIDESAVTAANGRFN